MVQKHFFHKSFLDPCFVFFYQFLKHLSHLPSNKTKSHETVGSDCNVLPNQFSRLNSNSSITSNSDCLYISVRTLTPLKLRTRKDWCTNIKRWNVTFYLKNQEFLTFFFPFLFRPIPRKQVKNSLSQRHSTCI